MHNIHYATKKWYALPLIIRYATEAQTSNLGKRIQKMGYGGLILKPNYQHLYNAVGIYAVSQGQEKNLLRTI